VNNNNNNNNNNNYNNAPAPTTTTSSSKNNNNNNNSAVQPLVGFGFLHNASPACFVPPQPMTPITAKSITTLLTILYVVIPSLF